MKLVKTGLGLAVLVSGSSLLAQPASRFTLSASGSFVDITKTTAVDEASGVDIKFKSGCGARLAGTFYVIPAIGVEAGASYQRVTGRLRVQGTDAVDLGSLKMIPLSLVAQYHFLRGRTADPWIGAGGSYTIFKNLSSADLDTAGLGTVEIKDRAAFLVNAGVDVRLTPSVGFLLDGRYTFLKPTSRGASGAGQELTLDPLEIAAGVRIAF
ncbi:MAG: OmpW family protein [Thermoanaerobaculia bacterium]